MTKLRTLASALIIVNCIGMVQAGAPERSAYLADKAAAQGNPTLTYIPHSLLVKFSPTLPPQAADQALAAVGATRVSTFGLVPGLSHVLTSLPVDKALAVLSANPNVEYAEPDYVQRAVAVPNDTYFGLQWGFNNIGQSINGTTGLFDADIDMAEAWDVTTGGTGCQVAVIDSGVQWSHPDLAANVWSNPGEIPGNGVDDDGNGLIDDTRGWDFYADDSNPDDENGHGTHVAGTIAAVSNNGTGVAGVAWNCKVVPLRFLGPDGSGSTADAISTLNYAVAKGIKVSNNSWGGGGYSSALYDAIANARRSGHAFVAAAGNDGVNTDGVPHYPSSYNLDNIISVAATDNRDQLASFSNYGANNVDIGAPGVDIASTYMGSNYVWMSGTSMASPHVAGVAGLLYQRNPGLGYSEIVARILSTARPIAALAGKSVTGGVLDAYAALTAGAAINSAPTATIASPASGAVFISGSNIVFSGSASDAEDGNLSANLVWTSNLDGQIGVGASIQTSALREGNHTITASVTDSGGLTGSQSIGIVVGTLPNAPDGISAVNNKNNTATVKWADRSNNETSFQIERQKLGAKNTWGTSSYYSVAANATSYIDKSGSGTFRYRVRARNAIGDSAWTAWAQVTVTRK